MKTPLYAQDISSLWQRPHVVKVRRFENANCGAITGQRLLVGVQKNDHSNTFRNPAAERRHRKPIMERFEALYPLKTFDGMENSKLPNIEPNHHRRHRKVWERCARCKNRE
jgi:hypothetical protein